MTDRVILEADGGSRGNPGPASYGALIRDADTGVVVAQRGETIGRATNNVAEYSGLIAGLELYREHTPDVRLEVRMDSKLVIEQMAGRWKIKHADMIPLAEKARRLLPPDVTWTWVPRERNKDADALANAALDDERDGGSGLVGGTAQSTPRSTPATGWSAAGGSPTTLVLVRHGVTSATERKAFSGSTGEDHGLTETGRQQADRAAAWIAERGPVDAIVTSPLRRTRETAAVIGRDLGLDVTVDAGLTETSFGDWDGYTFAEIQERWPEEMTAWLASTDVAPPGGESFGQVDRRISATRDALLTAHPGRTVVAVTHVTPIKLLVRHALGAPLSSIYKMELSPASVTTVAWWPDGNASLRGFNIVP
ncbi:bifunctional RNase H/acid phosphatase [Aeromicrobium chenweiae]|uniref:Bifunctional RNase H/acid phosphatase n=1 Tax=Aeromicrobium chenweiae TaxID=2079793 RepID=A0A2S0WKR7_9ACTN|nr:bifunctional RNase H/acid phosphatase [Aeromicrobium chenweiae]AWB91872.1 bifunctional RNase H/acid phosphatase [Aeromicrobium chenweiae]TGN32720.1 bifunctional RNase H/acid phosphatase [Aeromicrobium chenweiae]